MPKNKKIAEVVWTQLRGLYGSGLFSSIKEMYPHAQKIFAHCPSIRSIEARCQKDKWKKTLYRERQEAAQEQSFKKLFEDEGFGDIEMVRAVVAGAKHSDLIFEKVKQKLDEYNGAMDEEVIETLQAFVNDLKVSRLFIAERNKLTGSYAANKIRGSGLFGKVNDDETDDSIEELKLEHERLTKSLGL